MRIPGSTTQQPSADWAALLLRIVLGACFVAHIYRKFAIVGFGIWWTSFERAGYSPTALSYVVIVESLAAVLLPLGLFTRWISLVSLPALVGASAYWLRVKGFWFGDGGAEFTLLWSTGLIALTLLGDGHWALADSPCVRRMLFSSQK